MVLFKNANTVGKVDRGWSSVSIVIDILVVEL